MSSDPNFSHHNFKVEPIEIQGSIPPEIINIKSEPQHSYLAQILLERPDRKCPNCKIIVSEECFGQHVLMCSITEKENQLDADNNYSQISTFEGVMAECADSQRSGSTQQSFGVSRENDNEVNSYANYKHTHGTSEGSSSNGGPIASEDYKSDDESGNDFLLQDSTYSCSMCSFTTDREERLNLHERNHKNSTVPILNCIYCNQKYLENDLYLHIDKIHPGQKLQGVNAAGLTVDIGGTIKKKKLALQCSKCKYIARTRILLQAHLERHKFKETGTFVRKGGLWHCDLCSHATKGICDLQKHRKGHEYLPILNCPWCDFKSTNKIIQLHKVKCIQKPKKLLDAVESNPPIRNNIKFRGNIENLPAVTNNSKCSEKTENLSNPSVTNNMKSSERTKNVPLEVESVLNIIKQDVFKCANCPFSTDSPIILKSHMQYKHRLYKCLHCSIVAKNSFNFRKHLKLHKIYMQNLICSTCGFEGPAPTVKTHCAQKNHKYDKYNVKKKDGKTIMEDDDSSSKEEEEPKKIMKYVKQMEIYSYKCYNCSFSTINRDFLKNHLKTHIQKQPINKCSKCAYQSTPQSLHIHNLACHKTEELDIEHKVGQCFVCSASFIKNVNYQKHWKKHVEGYPIIKCCDCDFKSTSSVIITHRKQCKERFRNLTYERTIDLEKNQERVSDEENANTTQNKKFKHKVVQCNLCDAKLPIQTLNSHVESHARYPIKKCQQCNFKSTRRYLQTHVSDTGHYNTDRKYSFERKRIQCNLCDATPYKTHFGRHLESHSKMELKKCHQCSFRSTPKYVQTHVREMRHYRRFTKKPNMKSDLVNGNEKEGKEKFTGDNSVASENNSDDKSVSNGHVFQCSKCSFSTNLRIKLNMHDKKEHLDSILKKKKILNCSICSWATQNHQLLEEHLNGHYNSNKPVMQCAYCFFKGTPAQIKYHEHCTVPELENRTKPNLKVLLKCTQSKSCTFTTYSPADLKNHNHLKAIKCDLCSFSSFYQYRVDTHLLSHTKYNMPIENCPDCDYHSTPATLSAHKTKCLKKRNIEENLENSKKRRVTH